MVRSVIYRTGLVLLSSQQALTVFCFISICTRRVRFFFSVAHKLSDSMISQFINYDISSEDEIISETENNSGGNPTDNIHPNWNIGSSSDESSSNEVPLSRYMTNNSVSENEIRSKNGEFVWSKISLEGRGRLGSANLIKLTPGITRYASNRINTFRSAFDLFINKRIKSIVLKQTNMEESSRFGNEWDSMDEIELDAYLGLPIFAGVFKSNYESLDSLWSEVYGRPIFRATMSLKRFKKITAILRFDKRSDREARRQSDKLPDIRDVWDEWATLLPMYYNPNTNITIDEQLLSFRGRCPFRQHMPSKPNKYGIKFWILCDSETGYVRSIQCCTGKLQGNAPEKNQGMCAVLDLTEGLQAYNLTCDNFFTSYELAETLLDRKLTVLGTLRKNKPQIPLNLLDTKKPVFSSTFAFNSKMVLVSYIPKKNKNVILLSTNHNKIEIHDSEQKKPKTIMDYNATKGAVDFLDKMVSAYSCKRMTRRWPVAIFHNMIDISCFNAYVLYCDTNPDWKQKSKIQRRLFLEKLGMELVNDHIDRRKTFPRTNASLELVQRMKTGVTETTATSSAQNSLCIA
ncbi:piggyBac transposable element-derived protein 4-like [Bactrocera dorsalis]|uniref:PiggyBac transposable element-derived protein 4-like n=1 Tax=Bactrocera dorsalis TaxID=27457 RepID=A0ABM3K652_BACDO|nr:piggyBac transposable element-derived protein 4-like [Bactrocera dorsalis]